MQQNEIQGEIQFAKCSECGCEFNTFEACHCGATTMLVTRFVPLGTLQGGGLHKCIHIQERHLKGSLGDFGGMGNI